MLLYGLLRVINTVLNFKFKLFLNQDYTTIVSTQGIISGERRPKNADSSALLLAMKLTWHAIDRNEKDGMYILPEYIAVGNRFKKQIDVCSRTSIR